jgi:hypothetical protein
MLVLMLGFGNGLEHGVQRTMLGFAPNNVYMWGNRTSKPFKGMPMGRWVKLDLDDMAEIKKSVREIEELAPRIQLGGVWDGYWQYRQLRSRGNTIEAGTSEILRNIVAERVLGLPRSR